MTTTYAEAYGENRTSMSDADFYGRSPALGIDERDCLRAAVREIRSQLDTIIGGGPARECATRIKIARVKLAIALGNESRAMEMLSAADYDRPISDRQTWDETRRLAATLDAAANREYPHPALQAKLEELESELAR